MKKMIIICLIVILSTYIVEGIQSSVSTNKASLMIVAHPDDETIWGGNHLKKGNFYVVCLTNGNNEERKREFYNTLKKANVKGIILEFSDKTNGKRDDWKSSETQIKDEIRKIIDQKNWKTIVTHNPLGEYGHSHHKKTSGIVTEIVKENQQFDKLYYFGKYYKKKEAEKLAGKVEGLKHAMNQEDMNNKKELLSAYASQGKVIHNLEHMICYENWVAYQDWK